MDRNSIIAFVFVGILAFITAFYQSEMADYVRLVLEKGYLKKVIFVSVVVVVLTHAVRVKSNDSAGMVVRTGFLPLDIGLTIGTYSAVSTTACSLLEGAFIQTFYGDVVYFTKFEALDINVLLGVSGLLLWYVVFHMFILGKELFFPKYRAVASTEKKHNKSI